MSNLRAPLPVISAMSLSSSRSYMDNANLPLWKHREASVRYKRPESESRILARPVTRLLRLVLWTGEAMTKARQAMTFRELDIL